MANTAFWDEDESLNELLDNMSSNGKNEDDTTTEKMVPFEKIYANDFNREADREIDDLAENIRNLKVLLHNLVVRDDGNGGYMLVSGERRWRALNQIKETDPELFEKSFKELICKVIGKNVDMLNLRAMSYSANRQVPPTPEEDAKDLEDMRVIHAQMLERGDAIDKNFYEYITKLKDRSRRQVQKILSIEDYLIPELKDWYYKGAFDTNMGTVIAHYDDSVQKEALAFLKDEGDKLSKENADYLKTLNDQLKEEYADTFGAVAKAKLDLKKVELKERAGIELTEKEKDMKAAANEVIKGAAKKLDASVKEIKKAEKQKRAAVSRTGALENAVAKLKKKELTEEEKIKVRELIEELSRLAE